MQCNAMGEEGSMGFSSVCVFGSTSLVGIYKNALSPF